MVSTWLRKECLIPIPNSPSPWITALMIRHTLILLTLTILS